MGRVVQLSLLRPGSAGRTQQQKSRGRARAIATTGVLCSPALGESGTYPAVVGGGGGAENRNAPNDTAALSFVENSEAARYVFVVVVVGGIMIAGGRYYTFVLGVAATLHIPSCLLFPTRHRSERMRRLKVSLAKSTM